MDRYKATEALRKNEPIRTSDLEFINWLYDNGYQIVKVKITTEDVGTLQVNPKSKFMEEWMKTSESDTSHYYKLSRLAELTDKYKVDRFLPTPQKPMTREEEIEETKRRG